MKFHLQNDGTRMDTNEMNSNDQKQFALVRMLNSPIV
jgi:hypothetical protein